MDFQAFIWLTFDDIIVKDQTNVFGQIGEQCRQKFTESRRHFVEIKVMDDDQFAFGHSRIALDRIAQLIGRHRFSVKFKQIKPVSYTHLISVNPFFEYDLVKVPNGEIYVLAKELVNSVMQAAGIESWEVLATLLGSDLEMMKTQHPIMDRESVIITGEHVTLDAGTGCVHTAPGFGADDFIVCQKYNIPIIVPVDGKGYATEDAGKYACLLYTSRCV